MNQAPITIDTTVDAPLDQVWNRWTNPEHIVNWNFASGDWHCPNADNDLRPGGKFNYRMASRDEKMGFDFEGVYDEVTEGERISYIMPDGRRVFVTFENLGERTKVTETFDPESVNSVELQRAGWQAILDNFKKYAETK